MSDPADPEANPFERVVGPWERVIDDMHATAAQYRGDGREVVECHPGDVATLTGEPRTAAELTGNADPAEERRLGLDVVVPGDEFAAVREALGDRSPDRVEVFRATGNGLVFLLLVLAANERVVLLPVYYDRGDVAALRSIARDGGFRVHVRPLVDDERVTVTVDDPEPCFPG
jgi:hypothetical protein